MFDLDPKDNSYIPSGANDINNALFGTYHAKITAYERRALLDSFSKPDGVCHVLFSTKPLEWGSTFLTFTE